MTPGKWQIHWTLTPLLSWVNNTSLTTQYRVKKGECSCVPVTHHEGGHEPKAMLSPTSKKAWHSRKSVVSEKLTSLGWNPSFSTLQYKTEWLSLPSFHWLKESIICPRSCIWLIRLETESILVSVYPVVFVLPPCWGQVKPKWILEAVYSASGPVLWKYYGYKKWPSFSICYSVINASQAQRLNTLGHLSQCERIHKGH